jgi:endoglucanase
MFLVAAYCVCFARAQQTEPLQMDALAFHRASVLTHGMNLSGWFGGWGDYSPEHTSTYITEADFQSMHAMGVQYVRFPLDPVLMTQGGLLAHNKEELWKRIDHALDIAMNAGIAVDFVVFPRDDYKQRLATQAGADQFIMLWQVLAAHLNGRDPDKFFFELMNESEVEDSYRWFGIQSSAVRAIRQIDTKHTIIASGAHYDSLDNLIAMETINDPNVIYTFHFYEPYAFTHQGAAWGSNEWNYFKNIPYPPVSSQIEERMKDVPGDLARYELYLYGAGGWNESTIRQRIAFAAQWGHERDVPVICNEFGAYRDTAPADARARYLHDVRSALETNGIGWGMWDWSGNFGLVTHHGDQIVPDAADVQALGLR